MKVIVGSDHAGFSLKEHLKTSLTEWGHEVVDVGAHSTESTDYPEWGVKVAEAVLAAPGSFGLAVCGSGIGISIAANKVHGARAGVVHDETSARLSRQHNNANIICFGERLIGPLVAEKSLQTFLATEFEGGRHQRRVDKLDAL